MYYRNSVLFFVKDVVREIPCDKKVYIKEDFTIGTNSNYIGTILCDTENDKVILDINNRKMELEPFEKQEIIEIEDVSIMYFINDRIKVSTKGKDFIKIGDSKENQISLIEAKDIRLRLEGN
ncbi:hypothetical protein, partial [Clostridium beijerinckii]